MTDEWIQIWWYMYTVEYYLAMKNAFESDLMRWMNLEAIVQSEVSQKEKNKYVYYCMYMESTKMVLMNLLAGQQWRCRHREGIWTQCGRKRVGQIESGMETCALPYVK